MPLRRRISRGKSTRKDTRSSFTGSLYSPLLGSFARVTFLASCCLLHHSLIIAPWIPHQVHAEHHPTIPRSNNRYTHYQYSGSSSSTAADGAFLSSPGVETSTFSSSSESSSLNVREVFQSSSFHPPWNPSPKIDSNGFLSDVYARCPGEWEPYANIRGKHGLGRGILKARHVKLFNAPVMVRQVPGDGNCLFHSIAACLHRAVNGTHLPMNSHDRVGRLRCMSLQLRNAAVDVLEEKQNTWGGWVGRGGKRLFLQGEEYLEASKLLSAAAAQFDLSGENYCDLMRKESYWGGGPEIVALCNYLQRPIHM